MMINDNVSNFIRTRERWKLARPCSGECDSRYRLAQQPAKCTSPLRCLDFCLPNAYVNTLRKGVRVCVYALSFICYNQELVPLLFSIAQYAMYDVRGCVCSLPVCTTDDLLFVWWWCWCCFCCCRRCCWWSCDLYGLFIYFAWQTTRRHQTFACFAAANSAAASALLLVVR